MPTDRAARFATPPLVLKICHCAIKLPGHGGTSLSEADTSLWPFVVYFFAVLALVSTMLGLSWLLGQHRANAATNVPFESGALSVGSPQIHMAVEFYLIAIFFVIFDLETVFIFAWAVAFFELGWAGFISISIFILMLGVALVYELRSGALDWGIKTRSVPPISTPTKKAVN